MFSTFFTLLEREIETERKKTTKHRKKTLTFIEKSRHKQRNRNVKSKKKDQRRKAKTLTNQHIEIQPEERGI